MIFFAAVGDVDNSRDGITLNRKRRGANEKSNANGKKYFFYHASNLRLEFDFSFFYCK